MPEYHSSLNGTDAAEVKGTQQKSACSAVESSPQLQWSSGGDATLVQADVRSWPMAGPDDGDPEPGHGSVVWGFPQPNRDR